MKKICEDWWNTLETSDNPEYRRVIQKKGEEARRRKEIMMRGNSSVNTAPVHGKIISDKAKCMEEKRRNIWQPKKEKNMSEGYVMSLDECKLYHNAESVVEEVIRKKQTESVNLFRAAPKETTRSYGAGYSLEEYSRALLAVAKLINVGNRLYVYNGICYESCDVNDLIAFYRNRIDRGLYGAKYLKAFRELYPYLLADSRLLADETSMAPAEYCFLNNGIFDVKRQRLMKHTESQIAFSSVNARYIENPVCKKFKRFLNDAVGGDKTLIRLCWYILAYICMQSIDAKAFFVLGTAKDSGKSLIGNLIRNLFLPKHISAIALNDMNKEFSLAPIVGAAVNINMDLPKGKLNNAAVSKVKLLTGGDLMTISEKFVPEFTYLNRAKLIFGTNHPITLADGDDDAFWSRMVFMPFMYSVPPEKQNPRLLEEILEEKDSIVSKALQYGRELIENSYIFPSTPESRSYVASWRNDYNYFIDRFLRECCDMSDTAARELMENLYRAYCRFCEINGETGESREILKGCIERQKGVKHMKARIDNTVNPRSAFVGIMLSDSGRMLLNADDGDI